MSRIVIVGNSVAGICAIEEIRSTDPSSEITLLTGDEPPVYDRAHFASLVAKEIKESQVFYRPEGFYKDHHVHHMGGFKVTRINFRKNQVITEDKKTYDYDFLVLADTPEMKLPQVKGAHKAGVFGCVRLSDIKSIIKQAPLSESIVLQVTTEAGLNLAAALIRLKKDVIVVIPMRGLFAKVLDEESSQMFRQLLEQQGFRIIIDTAIDEILGDAETKAVRLRSGKVLAADLVIFDEIKMDIKFLAESPLGIEQRVTTNREFQTNIENVFAVDSVCHVEGGKHFSDYDTATAELEYQGRVVGARIAGRAWTGGAPVRARQFRAPQLTAWWAGKTQLEQGAREFLKFDPQHNIYKKIFAMDNSLVGAVVFNAPAEHEKFLTLIAQKTNVAGVEEYLLEANFSIEQALKLKDEQSPP